MPIIKLPAVAVSPLQPGQPYVSPKQSVAGGLIAMLFSLPGQAKLIGFSANFYANNVGTVVAGNSIFTDGIVRMPIQILVLPSLDPIASGILQLFFENEGSPGEVTFANLITGYAELRGFIYAGVNQAIAVFNMPNTLSFNITQNLASLIVESLGD
jgi:hypothetical protein